VDGDEREGETTAVTCTKEALEIEVARQKSAIRSLKTSLDALQQKNQNIESDISGYKASKSNLGRANTMLKKEFDDANRRLSETEERASPIESQLSAVEGEVKTLLNEEGVHSKRTSEIRTQCAEKAVIASELASLRQTSGSKAAELERKIKTKISIIESLEWTVKKARSEASDAEQNLDKVKFELLRYKRDLTEERMRTAELKQDLGKAFQRELEYDPQHLYKAAR
jgi:chromosome segregation ATPase